MNKKVIVWSLVMALVIAAFAVGGYADAKSENRGWSTARVEATWSDTGQAGPYTRVVAVDGSGRWTMANVARTGSTFRVFTKGDYATRINPYRAPGWEAVLWGVLGPLCLAGAIGVLAILFELTIGDAIFAIQQRRRRRRRAVATA